MHKYHIKNLITRDLKWTSETVLNIRNKVINEIAVVCLFCLYTTLSVIFEYFYGLLWPLNRMNDPDRHPKPLQRPFSHHNAPKNRCACFVKHTFFFFLDGFCSGEVKGNAFDNKNWIPFYIKIVKGSKQFKRNTLCSTETPMKMSKSQNIWLLLHLINFFVKTRFLRHSNLLLL